MTSQDIELNLSDLELGTMIYQEFEPDERLFAFAKIHDKLSDHGYWHYLKIFYEAMPRPYLINSFIGTLFHMDRPGREALWSSEAKDLYEKTRPMILRLYRGCWSANETGWNYYLDKSLARKAAIECPLDGQPAILFARIHKNDIEYITDSGSVIVDPRRLSVSDVRQIKMTEAENEAAFTRLRENNRPDEDDEHARVTFLMPVINTFIALKTNNQPENARLRVIDFFAQRAAKLRSHGFNKEADRIGVHMELLKSPTEEVNKWVDHFSTRVEG